MEAQAVSGTAHAYYRIVFVAVGLLLAQESDRAALNDMGRKALESDKFAEAEKQFAAAVEAAKSADLEDSTLVTSLVGLASARTARRRLPLQAMAFGPATVACRAARRTAHLPMQRLNRPVAEGAK
jgi:hypothetical protein